jgi:hypothetical protein
MTSLPINAIRRGVLSALLFVCALPAAAGPAPDKDPRAALPKTLPAWWDGTPFPEIKDGVPFPDARGQVEQWLASLQKQQEVKGWSWLGPFDNRDGNGLQTVYPPEEDYLKKGFDPGREYAGVTGKVRWSRPEAGMPPNNAPSITMFAYTRLEWPQAETITLGYMSDDGSILWINRKEAHRRSDYGEDYPTVALQKGTNELFVKVVNGGGPWDLRVSCLRISPPRCRLKSMAILLSRLPGKPDDQHPLLNEMLALSGQLNERELFRHYSLEGARLLARNGKKRNEFLREILACVERFNLSEMAPQLLELLAPHELEEETWVRYARAYQLAGNFDKALEAYRAVFESGAYLIQNRLQAGREMTELLATLGDHAGASQILAAMLKAFPAKQDDEAVKAARLAAESARDFMAVLNLDEDHERVAEQADRLLASEKDRDAFRLMQSGLLNAGAKCVRSAADPQLYGGAAEAYRAGLQRHQAAYTRFLADAQARRREEWERTRRDELLWSALAECFDPPSAATICLGAAQWAMERGQPEGALAWLQAARRHAPDSLKGEETRRLLDFAARAKAATAAADPVRVQGMRAWETPMPFSLFFSQVRARQPNLRLETLYAPAERGGVFYFANEDAVWAVAEGRTVWQWRSGGVSCREMVETPNVLLAARQRPAVDDRGVYARVLFPDAAGLDGRFGLVCLDRLTGREIWRTDDDESLARSHVNASPILEGGHVLVTAVTRPLLTGGDRAELSLVALDARTGEVRRRLFLCTNRDTLENVNPAFHIGPPACDDESIYLDTGLGAMACVERATLGLRWVRTYPRLRLGQEIFRARLMGRVNASPAPGRDAVAFAPSDSAFVYFLEPRTGRVIARLSSLSFRDLLGVRGDAAVFAGAGLTAVGVRDGKRLWQTPAGSPVRGAWMGESCVLAAFDNGARNLKVSTGTEEFAPGLDAGTLPVAAGRGWVAGLRGRQFRVYDNRPPVEAAVQAAATPMKPVRVSASVLPSLETGSIPYPGATLVATVGTSVVFQSLAWIGLYDVPTHREVWRLPNNNGRVLLQPPYLIHLEGGHRALSVVDLATGQEVFDWQVERFMGSPGLGGAVIRDNQLAFYCANRDWQTRREAFVYLYSLKDRTLVQKIPVEIIPPPRYPVWKDDLLFLGPGGGDWERDDCPWVTMRPLGNAKPSGTEINPRGRWDAVWDAQKGELLVAMLGRSQVLAIRPPFSKEVTRTVDVPKGKRMDDQAEIQYPRPLAFNDSFLVCPAFAEPRRVLDRKTLQPVTSLPDGDLLEVQPMPFGTDGLIYCGMQIPDGEPDRTRKTRAPPYRTVYALENGRSKPLGKIVLQRVPAQFPEWESHTYQERMNQVFFRGDGDGAWVFVGSAHYPVWAVHAADYPMAVYRARPKEGKLDGPFLLPLTYAGRLVPCGEEMATETPGGVVFFRLASAPAEAPARKAVPVAFQVKEDQFLLDGFLNDWDPKAFVDVGGGARMAARWDGERVRLAGVLPGRDGLFASAESLGLAITPVSQGFYQGWPLPWMRNRYRLPPPGRDGNGACFTVGGDGTFRFEALFPFETLFGNHQTNGRDIPLKTGRTFLLRLDVLAPGTADGTLVTLGGSATDPRPYEMIPLTIAPLAEPEVLKAFLGGGTLKAGDIYAEYRTGVGLHFHLRPAPKERAVIWTVQEKITRHSVLDFGSVFSLSGKDFTIRVLGPGGTPLAERTVKADAPPEPYRVPLGALAGQDATICVELTPARDAPVMIQKIEIDR